VREAPPELADPLSAMAPRFNLFFRLFARRFFSHVELPPEQVARLRELEDEGAVVYVMRYASRLDYFLMNELFRRHGLRLSGFANGIHFYYYWPLFEALRRGLRRVAGLRRLSLRADRGEGLDYARNLVRAGQSIFLFLRTARVRSWFRGRREAVELGRGDLDVVEEVVRSSWKADRPVAVVPVALFWRKGPRAERRYLNLAYGSGQRPSDLAKIASFLANYRGLCVKMGEPIDLRRFIEEHRGEGPVTVTRKIRRSIMLYLYREEKVVAGPTLRPRHRVEEEVLSDPRLRAAMEAWARSSGRSVEAAEELARRIVREIAADMNSTFLAALNLIATWVFRRMFAAIEVRGIEKVADYARRHPVLLAPNHRSYFDFLILSWLFYNRHLVPPHILARENMAFGPFGFIFRRAGAFFLRRNVDGPLYKDVFRAYVAYLVREGFTQEFFIEGGRSRTGKTLAPRLGFLSWNVDAFVRGHRRDLFVVPIAITYERLVEEGAMIEELEGAEKKDESVLGLVRARKYLQRRFGSVFVNFGEPISLAEFLGPRRALLARGSGPEVEEERRRVVGELGMRIVERINWATAVNATSVAACAILGDDRRGLFRDELVARMREIVDLLRLEDAPFTPALARDLGDFRESIAFLLRSDLLRALSDERGEILYFDESRRRALDFYRNSILHYLVTPSFLARGILRDRSEKELREDLGFWLDLLELEFFVPRGEVLAAHVDAFVDAFERNGLAEREDGRLRATELGRRSFRFLAAQTLAILESYYVAFSAVSTLLPEGRPRREIEKAVEDAFERSRILGEVRRPEARNPVTFRSALDRLAEGGVLEQVVEGVGRDGRRLVRLRPGPRFGELRGLRERLAAELSDR